MTRNDRRSQHKYRKFEGQIGACKFVLGPQDAVYLGWRSGYPWVKLLRRDPAAPDQPLEFVWHPSDMDFDMDFDMEFEK